MSIWTPYTEQESPPHAAEIVERVEWKLNQSAEVATFGLTLYRDFEPADASGRRIVISIKEGPEQIVAPGALINPDIQTTIIVPSQRDSANHRPGRLVAAIDRWVFTQIQGWNPDDAAADASFEHSLQHCSVLLPLTRVHRMTAPMYDAADDALYFSSIYRPILGPPPVA